MQGDKVGALSTLNNQGVIECLGLKYKQSEKSQKPFAENGEAQALSSGCHDSAVAYGINPVASGAMLDSVPAEETGMTLRKSPGGENGVVAVGFKAGQSKDGGLGDEREVSPTLSHKPSALEPTVAIDTLLAAMRYIVRRLTPTECERLMGLPDGYTIPVGLDPNDPALVEEFRLIHDTFNAIMAAYEGGKPPKPKTVAQVQKWLAKITNPETCPDSPRYKACGNGWATNQPRWILCRLLAADGIDPFNETEET